MKNEMRGPAQFWEDIVIFAQATPLGGYEPVLSYLQGLVPRDGGGRRMSRGGVLLRAAVLERSSKQVMASRSKMGQWRCGKWSRDEGNEVR